MKIETATLNREVTVYSAPWCGGCKITKTFLDSHNIEYREVDVSTDTDALAELKAHGYSSIPVVSVGSLDNSWCDHNPQRLEELVNESF